MKVNEYLLPDFLNYKLVADVLAKPTFIFSSGNIYNILLFNFYKKYHKYNLILSSKVPGPIHEINLFGTNAIDEV